MLYAHKKHLVSVVMLMEEVKLITFGGPQFGNPGDYLVTDQVGNKSIVPANEFKAEWEAVKKIDLKEYMKQGYEDMGDINLEEAEAGKHTYTEGLFTNKPC